MWLRDVPGIEFRTDNEPFKVHSDSNAHFTFPLELYFIKFCFSFVIFVLYNHMFLFAIFQKEMQKFVTKIVDLMREAKLFCWQGGPIIMLQVILEFCIF